MADGGFLRVDGSRCSGDGACARVCPMGLFDMKDGRPVASPRAEQACIGCGHCVAVCPQGALSIPSCAPGDCMPTAPEVVLDDVQMERLLRSRRSIRNFQDRPVEKEKLARLVDIAHYAPSAGNSQQAGWLVINSREKVKRVAAETAAFLRHLAGSGDPVAVKYGLAALADAWDAGHDGIALGAHALVIAHAPKAYNVAPVDCSIAMTYLNIAAPSLGLGACWGGFIMMAAARWQPLQDVLALPQGHACFGAMMVGYPVFRFRLLPPRNRANLIWL